MTLWFEKMLMTTIPVWIQMLMTILIVLKNIPTKKKRFMNPKLVKFKFIMTIVTHMCQVTHINKFKRMKLISKINLMSMEWMGIRNIRCIQNSFLLHHIKKKTLNKHQRRLNSCNQCQKITSQLIKTQDQLP